MQSETNPWRQAAQTFREEEPQDSTYSEPGGVKLEVSSAAVLVPGLPGLEVSSSSPKQWSAWASALASLSS